MAGKQGAAKLPAVSIQAPESEHPVAVVPGFGLGFVHQDSAREFIGICLGLFRFFRRDDGGKEEKENYRRADSVFRERRWTEGGHHRKVLTL
jgi:hypothetical protein